MELPLVAIAIIFLLVLRPATQKAADKTLVEPAIATRNPIGCGAGIGLVFFVTCIGIFFAFVALAETNETGAGVAWLRILLEDLR